MESCFLCLEINNDLVGSIEVNSTQWQEFNIERLIEKHLLHMEAIPLSSWLCATCWQELYQFHNFYTRVQEAHKEIGSAKKIEVANGSYFEPEITMIETLLPELILEEQKIIKEEHNEDLWETMVKDPLKTTRKLKRTKTTKTKTKKNEAEDSSTNEGNEILFDTDVLSGTPLEEEILLDQLVSEYQNVTIKVERIDTSEYVDNSSDSDHSFTESDNKSVDKAAKRIKKTKSNIRRERDCSKLQATDIFLSKNFNMSCVLCETPMNNFKALLQHFDMEHKERGYVVCCEKKIYKRSVLLEHVNHHVDPNYLKCNQCDKVFSTRKALKTHQLLHLSEEEKKFSCNECGKNFGGQHLLSHHIRSVHLRTYIKICDMCGKTLRSSDTFERHMSEHEGKPMPPVNCGICGLRLSNQRALKRHMKTQHPVGGKQSHICHICLKVLSNIVALKKHIHCTHNTGNIHKCTTCGKGFKRAQGLRDHMATHTGNALYTCPWCPKTFNSNGYMHAHRKKYHPKEWEEAHRQKYLEKYKLPAVTEIINGGIS